VFQHPAVGGDVDSGGAVGEPLVRAQARAPSSASLSISSCWGTGTG
jgi:hypothetical protein